MSLLRLLLPKIKYSKISKICPLDAKISLRPSQMYRITLTLINRTYQMSRTTPQIYQMHGLFNLLLYYSNISLAEYYFYKSFCV
jgi:hypothetical protein